MLNKFILVLVLVLVFSEAQASSQYPHNMVSEQEVKSGYGQFLIIDDFKPQKSIKNLETITEEEEMRCKICKSEKMEEQCEDFEGPMNGKSKIKWFWICLNCDQAYPVHFIEVVVDKKK